MEMKGEELIAAPRESVRRARQGDPAQRACPPVHDPLGRLRDSAPSALVAAPG